MKRWVKRTALASGAVLGGVVAASALGSVAWSRATARTVDRLMPPEPAAPVERFSREQLAGLPSPVVRYFEFALTPGQPLVRSARIEHRGEFRGGLDAAWSPFHSVEHFATRPPGFVWDASIRMAPLMTVRVRDSYAGGQGAMLGKVAGLVPVVNQHGSPELASGALMRYLAEAPWVPTALLPSQGVVWEAMDDSRARATLSDAGITVTAVFHFGPQGEIVRVEAERYRDVKGVGVLTPWGGRFREYAEIEGMRIPMQGEVEWILPEGRLSYWRGRITRAEYQFAQ